MKSFVIFLDVDGVLNSVESKLKLDDKNFQCLKRLIDKYDSDIVLSSTWRKTQEDYDLINRELTEKVGVSLSGKTGIDYENRYRGKEILDFLKEHDEIKDYIVIDDDSCNIKPYIHSCNFIHTNNMYGLRDVDVDDLFKRRELREFYIKLNKKDK